MYAVVIIIASSVMILLVAIDKVEASNGTNFIPSWVKKDAVWWHDGKISDNEFINNIKWSVETKIIPIQLVVINNYDTQKRPYEFKDIAYYWGTGKISDKDFVSTIRYLVKNGMIKMDESFVSDVNQKMKTFSVVNETEKSVVVIPVLTSSAYSERGFYAHYRGECAKCLTIKIRDDTHSFVDSNNGLKVLQSLGYNTITDIDIDKNPKILEKYDEVILLHNEYVTQREFDAIAKHPQVLYLYPNALYAKVSINYWNDTVTLVRGHGYPNSTIANGFGWKFDNSKLEYNRDCGNWNFHKIYNGIMLNCYPEGRLDFDIGLLQAITDF
jgi:hypothetical protein